MTPRQFPNHPAVRAAGAVVVLCLLQLGLEFVIPEASAAGPETITWRSDYDSAYYEAKGGKRLLWIQFTGPWCPNCRRMEHDSFPHARVVEHARESFVPVKLRSDENEELAMRFNLSGLPATVVIDPATQKILSLHQGYLGPDELGAVFREAYAVRDKANETQLASASKKVKGDRPTPAIQVIYSRVQQQGLRADFGISNLSVALLSSAMKAGSLPKGGKPALEGPRLPVALSGYCPVSLVTTHKLVRGVEGCTIRHEGKLYRFANEEMSGLFRENPDRYLPINGGHCPVAGVEREKTLDGDARYGVLYRERLYLCASSADRGRFLQDPERYALAHVEQKGYCPHCAKGEGLLVRGDPRFGLIRSGREYWFPDAEHRSAFLASLASDANTVRK